MQDGRIRSRSQEIIFFFCEELSSSDRTELLVVSEDIMRLNVEQTHDRTERPVDTLHTAEAQDSSRVRSAHESNTFNVNDEVFRERMEKFIADHDESHEPMLVNEADMNFRIPELPHSVGKYAQSTSVRNKLESPLESAMPCKVEELMHDETCDENTVLASSKYSCIVEVHESTRKRIGKTQLKVGNGFNSMKISDA